jgi:hypothetical protein
MPLSSAVSFCVGRELRGLQHKHFALVGGSVEPRVCVELCYAIASPDAPQNQIESNKAIEEEAVESGVGSQ